MPTIYSDASDGSIYTVSTSNWAAVRDATTGTAIDNDTRRNYAVRARAVSGGRGNQWQVWRTFMYFNTTGVTETLASATINIRGYQYGTADLWVVKSSHGTTLSGADFDKITGWSSGADNSSNVTKYCDSEVTTWSTSGYNSIALNAAALSDIVSLNDFCICLIEADYDLPNNEPTPNLDVYSGAYFSDHSGTSYDPYIHYTVATVSTDNATFFGTNF